MLGVALIDGGAAREALTAYRKALEYLGRGSVAVNEGQVLYQIGLCHGLLNDYVEAVAFCARAARRFHATGMREYLSAAVSGVGYALLEVDDDTARQHCLPPEVLRHGLIDAVATVEQRLSDPASLDYGRWLRAVGYVFGAVVAVSLSDDTSQLVAAADTLRNLNAQGSSRPSTGSHPRPCPASSPIREAGAAPRALGTTPPVPDNAPPHPRRSRAALPGGLARRRTPVVGRRASHPLHRPITTVLVPRRSRCIRRPEPLGARGRPALAGRQSPIPRFPIRARG